MGDTPPTLGVCETERDFGGVFKRNVSMEPLDIKPIIEGLIFVSESPLGLDRLSEVLAPCSPESILEAIRRIQSEYEDDSKGLELVEIAGGYQFRTKPRLTSWMSRLKKAKPVKLSQAALETLAIVAYRQPIIRPAIEEIRGVDSGGVLRTLLEKGLIRIVGRKDLPGRPILYATTKSFLETFSLNALSDLPTLREIESSGPPEEELKREASPIDQRGPTSPEVLPGDEGRQ